MSRNNNLSFQKAKPKFLQNLYKQVGYQEPDKERDLNLKRVQESTDDAEEGREREDREDEAPMIVVLDEKKHVDKEEYEEIIKSGGKLLDASEVKEAKRKLKDEVVEKFARKKVVGNQDKTGGKIADINEADNNEPFSARPVFRVKKKAEEKKEDQPAQVKKAKVDRRTLSFEDE